MVLSLYFLALVALDALAAPAGSSESQTLSNLTQNFTDTTSSPFTDAHSTYPPITSSQPLSSPSASSSPTSFTTTPTGTLLVTEVATAFETTTVYATPSSTAVVTVIVTTTITTTPTTPTPSQGTSSNNRTKWSAPKKMADLSAFNVTSFPTGQKNLVIVSEIPFSANSRASKVPQSPPDSHNATNPSSILQLVYPAHSVNPGSKPAGGADFYASPLDLAGSRNVTLEYSVFFPADFEWVKGGKLPGLYGGHTGCSGGSSADDCFSTRMMWRQKGVGELYLYAPKDKQSDALCSDPQSVCDATYGFSIGRGSFNFTPGDWTSLRQDVVLNTPGERDGAFTLFVNGEPVISRTDVFYRHAARSSKSKSSPKTTSHVPASSRVVSPTQSRSSGAQDPLLGLLGLLKRQPDALIPTTTGGNELEATRSRLAVSRGEETGSQPAEFIGIFFSTFFGGHGSEYATPKRQYTWFKDFSITRHD